MRVKTFEAVDMKQALTLVKDELGPSAVIVSSRPVRRDGGLFGLLGRKVLEVTAAAETANETEELLDVRGTTPPKLPSTRTRGAGGHSKGVYREIWAVQQAMTPVLDEVRSLRDSIRTEGEEEAVGELRSDLSQIRSMLSSLTAHAGFGPDPEGAAAQRLLYGLLGRGVEESLARSLVQRVVARIETGSLADLERLKLNLAAEMRRDLERAQRGAPPSRIQLFTGPTGVGKTTTIAKLAARAQRGGGNPLIITTDVHRVAAVEQMVRFGDLVSVPVEVAIGPDDLRRTLERASNKDQIFIDTAGRNHRDGASFRQLEALIDAAGDSEVMLVLAVTLRSADSADILESYAELPWSRLVMTKLDETRVYGELFNNVVRSGRPIACVTTGQSVPEHLEAIEVSEILRKVLQG